MTEPGSPISTSQITVRPARASDLPAIALIGNATWPDFSVTALEIEARDARRSSTHQLRRRVAVRDAQIVGWSLLESDPRGMHRGAVQIRGAVLPSARGMGVGRALSADVLQALVAGDARSAFVEVREHHQAARAFVEARGFAQAMRYAVSRLTLAGFDAAPYADRVQRTHSSGVRIVSARALRASHADAITRINALRWAVAQDVPALDAPLRESDATLAAYLDHQPTALPDGWLIAREGDVEVGFTSMWRSLADPTVVHTGVTGVLPGWRRRGIALALKVQALEYARGIGARRIITDNEENNPMYPLNLMLGFEPQPAWLGYRRSLTAASGKSAAK